ncbi:MAG: DUF3450 family protein [Verrucomicrobiae bacterium]|nr:DUF3450 family protein [Verrucomicrobiae bacterium]
MRKFVKSIGWLACIVLTQSPLVAQEDVGPGAEETRQAVAVLRSRLQETRDILQGLQQLEREWEEDRGLLEQGIDARKSEIEGLTDDIAKAEERKLTASQESAENAERRLELEQVIDVVEEQLKRFEDHLRRLVKWMPEPFLTSQRTNIATLNKAEELENGPLAQRVQLTLTLLTQMEKFQSQIFPVEGEMRSGKDGKDRLVNTIYYGLALAFSYGDGKSSPPLALVGYPTDEGWKFEEKPEFANEIGKIVALGSGGGGEPAVVNLAARIVEGL